MQKTQRGVSDPSQALDTAGAVVHGTPGARFDFDEPEPTVVTLPPFVEVELVYERAQEGMRHERWCALEVWTQNRIYACDWAMRCIQVIDRASGVVDLKHPLLGSLLAGGQRKEDEAMELCSPIPRPGTEAVFEYVPPRKGFVNTSTVTRVVLRLRVLTVPLAPRAVDAAWDRLSDLRRRRDG
ncbi:MAG: hypothetical protein NZ898_09285 [Myxococcota bacterium]|nr:hypothetical protein [Myxococcota bacterium]MDW8361630.1 hypothetical protein [Myxococcales bacterium]